MPQPFRWTAAALLAFAFVFAPYALTGCGSGSGSSNSCPAGQHAITSTAGITTCIADSRFAGNWSGVWTQQQPGTETGTFGLSIDTNGAANGTLTYSTSKQVITLTGRTLITEGGTYTFTLPVFSQNTLETAQLTIASNGHLTGTTTIPSGLNASNPITIDLDLTK